MDNHCEEWHNCSAESLDRPADRAKEVAMNQLAELDDIKALEGMMLDLPQADCPVVHHFGPGIYIREVTLPAGILAVGHFQKFEQLNIVLKGSVAILVDGEIKVIAAPTIFVGKPGRKFGYVLEECVWQNVYATDETDIDKLESMFIEKSDVWLTHEESKKLLEGAMQ